MNEVETIETVSTSRNSTEKIEFTRTSIGVYKIVKRFFDIVISSVMLILLFPIFVFVFLAIKLEDGGSVFYRQVRTGKGGNDFLIFKFRSMKEVTEVEGRKLKHNERVTKVGKFLRRTSVDELPQIINVLKGEMSIIGPRPWIPEYYQNFTEEQKHRCDVLPGITGLAQARGRNGLNVFEKINYDLQYGREMSLKLDLLILKETFSIVSKEEHTEIIQEDMYEEIRQLKEQER